MQHAPPRSPRRVKLSTNAWRTDSNPSLTEPSIRRSFDAVMVLPPIFSRSRPSRPWRPPEPDGDHCPFREPGGPYLGKDPVRGAHLHGGADQAAPTCIAHPDGRHVLTDESAGVERERGQRDPE